MNNVTERKCRCGNAEFTAHQLTRHDVLVNSIGVFLEDKGIYDVEYPYGPFTCTVCGTEYEELGELEGGRVKNVVTTCLNGRLSAGDMVVSVQGDEYKYMVGSVLEINLFGMPDHDTENTTDDVHVDFSIMGYSGSRKKKIAQAFSAAYGHKKAFRECPIDDVIMDPANLICITSLSRRNVDKLLESEENAMLFCGNVKKALAQTGVYQENQTGQSDKTQTAYCDEISEDSIDVQEN